MTDFPFTWPYSMFFPKDLNQSINPGWSFGGVSINYAGNPAIERDVIEKVASYGKQLGIITEAVLALADGKPGDKSVKRLREIAEQIEQVKNKNKASLRDQARDAMDRLAKAEPATARRIAAKYTGE